MVVFDVLLVAESVNFQFPQAMKNPDFYLFVFCYSVFLLIATSLLFVPSSAPNLKVLFPPPFSRNSCSSPMIVLDEL